MPQDNNDGRVGGSPSVGRPTIRPVLVDPINPHRITITGPSTGTGPGFIANPDISIPGTAIATPHTGGPAPVRPRPGKIGTSTGVVLGFGDAATKAGGVDDKIG